MTRVQAAVALAVALTAGRHVVGQGQGRGGPSGTPPDDGHGGAPAGTTVTTTTTTTGTGSTGSKTTSVTTYLFDLASDPYEATNLASDSSMTSVKSQLQAKHSYYASSVVQPTSIDYTVAYTYFQKCGGVCSYLSGDETESASGAKPRRVKARELKSSSKKASSKSEDVAASSSQPNIVFVLVDDWGWVSSLVSCVSSSPLLLPSRR